MKINNRSQTSHCKYCKYFPQRCARALSFFPAVDDGSVGRNLLIVALIISCTWNWGRFPLRVFHCFRVLASGSHEPFNNLVYFIFVYFFFYLIMRCVNSVAYLPSKESFLMVTIMWVCSFTESKVIGRF